VHTLYRVFLCTVLLPVWGMPILYGLLSHQLLLFLFLLLLFLFLLLLLLFTAIEFVRISYKEAQKKYAILLTHTLLLKILAYMKLCYYLWPRHSRSVKERDTPPQRFHRVTVVLTLVQTKQIRINIHKQNNAKTQYIQYKSPYKQYRTQ